MPPISNQIVPFFTPIESANYPILEAIDHYLWFGGKVAQVIDPEQMEGGSIETLEVEGSTKLATTALKVVSMILSMGILPLLAFVLKVIIRSYYQFHFADRAQPKHPNGHDLPLQIIFQAAHPVINPAIDLQQEEIDRATALALVAQDLMDAVPVVAPESPSPAVSLSLEDMNLILHTLSALEEEQDKINTEREFLIENGQPLDELLVRQDKLTESFALVEQIPLAQIVSHYAQLRVEKGIAENVPLLEVNSQELLNHYRYNVEEKPINYQELSKLDLIHRLEYLGDRELGLVRAANRAPEVAQIKLEHDEEAEIERAMAASAADLRLKAELQAASNAIEAQEEKAEVSPDLIDEKQSAAASSRGEAPVKRPSPADVRAIRLAALANRK